MGGWIREQKGDGSFWEFKKVVTLQAGELGANLNWYIVGAGLPRKARRS